MIIENKELHGRTGVFTDRAEAGSALARWLTDYAGTSSIMLAIPTGGIPVAVAAAKELGLLLAVAVVSKITFPWNSEAGFGAVAFDGTVRLNDDILGAGGMSEVLIQKQIESARAKVNRRVDKFTSLAPLPELHQKTVILIDDGIASGFTTKVAVEAVKNKEPAEVVIAVPTGHQQSLNWLDGEVDRIYCANVRGGFSFAVAAAYKKWYDVGETEATEILKQYKAEQT